MTNVVLHILHEHDLSIMDCRGQSYDNASNMSGKYRGLQARISEVNPLAVYVPCSAHSLNLVGSCAAECCVNAPSFFGFVQTLFNFFSASTHRWSILKSTIHGVVIKSLSTTRWSARADATHSLKEYVRCAMMKPLRTLKRWPSCVWRITVTSAAKEEETVF